MKNTNVKSPPLWDVPFHMGPSNAALVSFKGENPLRVSPCMKLDRVMDGLKTVSAGPSAVLAIDIWILVLYTALEQKVAVGLHMGWVWSVWSF